MALLERVATLIRANINDLVEQAEDPEKLVKQLVLDMQNQLLQVKTQVAVALADQHLLDKKRAENQHTAGEWRRRAELAVDKGEDDLARAALQRALNHQRIAERFGHQAADQNVNVETLKAALRELEQKLADVQARGELLIAQHRRARAARRATKAHGPTQYASRATLDRLQNRVADAETDAAVAVGEDSLEDRLATLEREDEIERMLAEIKSRRSAG